jgi:DNA primase
MPGVDYRAVEARVPMAKVLELLGLAAQGAAGGQFRGPCPVHGSQSPHSRSFSANLARGVCRCFKCGFARNQVQLWAALKKMSVYEAAVDLCRQAGVEVPWIERW